MDRTNMKNVMDTGRVSCLHSPASKAFLSQLLQLQHTAPTEPTYKVTLGRYDLRGLNQSLPIIKVEKFVLGQMECL